MENTAKIHIMGAAAVLVSGVKLDDWKRVKKYAPEALKIVDENGDAVFRITPGEGGGSVDEHGICWGTYTSEEGCATVTVLLDDDVEDKKAAIVDVMGTAILDLMELEKKIPSVLDEIRQKEQAVEACITVV